MTSLQQRAELQRQIWAIANEVRGSVDGWDFKQYVLGTLFYRFISENFTDYITGGDEGIDAAKRYIASSLKREYASENGTALNDALPKLSPLNPQYRTQKQTVFQKMAAFVDKFKGVGGEV